MARQQDVSRVPNSNPGQGAKFLLMSDDLMLMPAAQVVTYSLLGTRTRRILDSFEVEGDLMSLVTMERTSGFPAAPSKIRCL